MRLTVKSEYGLLALIDLASNDGGGPVSARELSERQHIPGKYLEQLLVALRRGGLVAAVRGARGGFVLQREPADITVLDIVEALEGPLAPTTCSTPGRDACAREGTCAAGRVWDQATQALKDVFRSTTLADLAHQQAVFDDALVSGEEERHGA